MLPKHLASKAILEKRKTAFKDLRTSRHHPIKFTVFPVNPRTYGVEMCEFTPVNQPKLTDVGNKLFGF